MKGVQGEVTTLNKRRGRKDALHSALQQARIDRGTLEAMLGAMQASFPMFRKYFHHKARLIGKEKLAWWDIYAPVGKADAHYTFDEASNLILSAFAQSSPALCPCSSRAFRNDWIAA